MTGSGPAGPTHLQPWNDVAAHEYEQVLSRVRTVLHAHQPEVRIGAARATTHWRGAARADFDVRLAPIAAAFIDLEQVAASTFHWVSHQRRVMAVRPAVGPGLRVGSLPGGEPGLIVQHGGGVAARDRGPGGG
jgi:hypothetical protein